MVVHPNVIQRIILVLGGLLLLLLSAGTYGIQPVIAVTISTIFLFLASTKKGSKS